MAVVVRSLAGTLVGGVLCAVQLGAQTPVATGTITGQVLDSASQQPLSNVTIAVPGTQRGALTRNDGSFVLAAVPAGARQVRAARIGYGSQTRDVTVTAGATVTVRFVLTAAAAQLSEVVVTGYGTQSRASITGSVATVNADQANVGVQPNVNQLIQGRAAGVQITSNSGDPGGSQQIRIRGGTSISASDEPLYVIDGVPILNAQNQVGGVGTDDNAAPLARSPLTLLNPNDISEITVLKDASATAIYGSRAANGVILITTKKGTAGQTTTEYDGYVAAASAARELDVLNGSEYRAFVQGEVAGGRLPESRLQSLGPANTNWQEAILRTARVQNHNLAFSGGSPSTQYRASVNYFDQPGIVIGSGLTRYQGRLNGTSRLLNDRLNVNLNLNASQTRDRFLLAENAGGFLGGVFTNVLQFNPTQPVTTTSANGASAYYELGTGAQGTRNPVALAEQVNDRATANRILGNLQATYSLLEGLTATANVGVDRTGGNRGTYYPLASPLGAQYGGLARQANRDLAGATVQTLLTYDRDFDTGFLGRQTFNLVGGYEYQEYRVQQFGAETRNFTNDVAGPNNLSGGIATNPPFSSLEFRRTASFFTRLNYGLKDRYFITGVVRRDGASVFGPNNKYAVFPSVSASWRVSEEGFMRDRFFSDLRLRAGYGIQGNQAINPYQSLALLATDANARYPFGGTLATGVFPTRNANPDLRWEQTSQANVGLDYGLLDNRITGTLEYYSKSTRDLLLDIAVPQPSVVGTQIRNVGRVKNAGFEASLDGTIFERPSRTLSAGLVFSADRNRVVSLGGQSSIRTGRVNGGGLSGTQAQLILVGEPLGTFVGREFAGVNAEGQELFNSYDDQGQLVGTVTGDQSDGNDLRVLGNANPKFNLGLRSNGTWGRFDGSFLVRAVGGNKIYNNTANVYATKANVSQNQNFLRSALNDNISIDEPRYYSSRFIEDGSFVRLQNVTVGYTFDPQRYVRRVTSARVYLSGDNLLLGTDYTGLDPEVFSSEGLAVRGIDYITYPRARTFTAGLRLGL